MTPFLLLLAFASPFQFREASSTAVELVENGRPVYVYNHGMTLAAGSPELKRRAAYLHPVRTPAGTVVTDDFPKDHLHHRGIFWAWPIVRHGGQRYDLWGVAEDGLRTRFVKWIAKETRGASARLAVENGWFAGEEQIVRETVDIVADPAKDGRRRLHFTLAFTATRLPIELEGDQTDDKGYGGFCVRFAPRTDTVIETDGGAEAKDTNMVPHAWAQLAGVFGGAKAAVRVDDNQRNPAYPNGWCLRRYGFLGVNYPGRKVHTLKPRAPLVLRYTVTLMDR
jgi:hypothetical protein